MTHPATHVHAEYRAGKPVSKLWAVLETWLVEEGGLEPDDVAFWHDDDLEVAIILRHPNGCLVATTGDSSSAADGARELGRVLRGSVYAWPKPADPFKREVPYDG